MIKKAKKNQLHRTIKNYELIDFNGKGKCRRLINWNQISVVREIDLVFPFVEQI